MQEVDLKNRIALITGASRGIGAEIAKAYAKAGAHVILIARTVGGLEEVDDKIRQDGGQATLMPLDLLKLNDLDMLGSAILERFGKLDIFVGNAGILGTLGPFPHSDPKEWQKVYDLNVHANMRLIRTLDLLLKNSDSGRVIITGSITAHRPKAYWAQYRSSKAAVESMMLCYADEVKNTNMKVNIVYPPPTQTRILNQAYPGGYQGDDIKSPEDVIPIYLKLADPSLQDNGKIFEE